MEIRNIIKTVKGHPTIDGAGVHLIRVLGPDDVGDIDPFLMLDAFDSKDPNDYIKGFPFHPHRGIETITYLIKGRIDHEDSLGNSGTIHEGESQWMTAGKGILHEEMPKKSDRLFGLQIWLNIPQNDKMCEPAYFDISKDMIKKVAIPQGNIKVISGSYEDIEGVKTNHTQATIFDISLNPEKELEIPINKDKTLFIYLFEGDGYFGKSEDNYVENRTVAIFGEGETFYGKSGEEGVRFMLFAGKPLNEPIAWGGPIVMNTDEELATAFEELRKGTFIK